MQYLMYQSISSIRDAEPRETETLDRPNVTRASIVRRDTSGQIDLLLCRQFAYKLLGLFISGFPVARARSLGFLSHVSKLGQNGGQENDIREG